MSHILRYDPYYYRLIKSEILWQPSMQSAVKDFFKMKRVKNNELQRQF